MRKDWEEIEFGDLCKFSQGVQVPKGKQYSENNADRVRFLRIVDFTQGNEEPRYIEKPDDSNIVTKEDISMVRYGTVGFVCTGKEGAIANNLFRVIPKIDIENSYLINYLQSSLFKRHLNSKGATMQALSFGLIKPIKIPLPSIEEQQVIVAKIEELFSDLDKGVAELKKAQDQLKVYRQSVLKKAFEGEWTKEWREQQTNLPTADELLEQIKEERQKHYEQQLENWKQAVKSWEENGKEGKKPNKPKFLKDPNKIEDGEIESYNNLPNSWLWSRLANTVVDHSSDIVDGPFGSNLKSTEYQDEGKPILRIQNIKSNQFIDKNIKCVSNEKYNFLKRHQFKPNDVIVTKLGDPLGLACRVPLDFKSGVIVADLIRIRPSSSYINYDWLTLLINSIVIQSQFRKITKGTTRPRMNLTIMRNVIIPLPSYEEQHQIVKEIESRLSVCDKVEESITESLEKAKALRQSILKKAFEGNLLSTQEIEKCKTAPDYEPAAVLLEKIKMKQ